MNLQRVVQYEPMHNFWDFVRVWFSMRFVVYTRSGSDPCLHTFLQVAASGVASRSFVFIGLVGGGHLGFVCPRIARRASHALLRCPS